MRDAEAVTFAGATLDRAAHMRGDAGLQAAMLADPAARVLPLWRGKALMETDPAPRLAWLPTGSAVFDGADGLPVFLGLEGAEPRFAREVPDWPGAPPAARGFVDTARESHPALPRALGFGDLRAAMAALPAADAGNAAAAKGILGWHATHGCCARCGAASHPIDAGWRRACPRCGAEHFPRTDPVVIMLVLHGNAVLLGRSPAWPEGMYSLLAGFMEPGESIEAAVRRETREEAGVRVGAVDYLSSQPWPFPSSLMIGCRAEAVSRDLACDPAEIEDARWLTREQVLAALEGRLDGLRPARRGSIARFLLERWLADRLA